MPQATFRGHLVQASPSRSFIAVANPRTQRKPNSSASACLPRQRGGTCIDQGRTARSPVALQEPATRALHTSLLRWHGRLRWQVLLDAAVMPQIPLQEPLPKSGGHVCVRDLLVGRKG